MNCIFIFFNVDIMEELNIIIAYLDDSTYSFVIFKTAHFNLTTVQSDSCLARFATRPSQ